MAATQYRLLASGCEAPRACDVIAPNTHVTQRSFFVSELVVVIYTIEVIFQ